MDCGSGLRKQAGVHPKICLSSRAVSRERLRAGLASGRFGCNILVLR